MLDVATVVDPVLDRDDEARGHETDHQQSPHGDSASSFTPLKERNVIHGRDARSRIENRR
jgi:hypothetical protein